MKAWAVTLALVLGAGCMPLARAQIALPTLEARVTDLTGTLTAAQQSSLEEKLTAFEARKGAQIAVLILPTTQPEDIAQFGVRLLESWKLGRKGLDDGAVLIVAKDDRAVRIEVQYGLEGVLTDATSGRIIDDTILPLFKEGDFAAGVNAGVDQMIRVVDGEPLPPPDSRWRAKGSSGGDKGFPISSFVLMAIMFVGGLLRTILGRGLGALIATVLSAVLLFFVTHSIIFAIVVAAIVGLVLMGAGGSGGNNWTSGRGGSGWSGGGGGGGGSGGFSGGGGRGGGGGATGRW